MQSELVRQPSFRARANGPVLSSSAVLLVFESRGAECFQARKFGEILGRRRGAMHA